MNVSIFDDELGEHYWCERSDPDSHTARLMSVARGDRRWEAGCAQRLEIKAEYERRIRAALSRWSGSGCVRAAAECRCWS